jgi:hypothetical protein
VTFSIIRNQYDGFDVVDGSGRVWAFNLTSYDAYAYVARRNAR